MIDDEGYFDACARAANAAYKERAALFSPDLRALAREIYTGQRLLDDELVAQLDALDAAAPGPKPKQQPDPPWETFWSWTAEDDAR